MRVEVPAEEQPDVHILTSRLVMTGELIRLAEMVTGILQIACS
jgi:hypothetical protein